MQIENDLSICTVVDGQLQSVEPMLRSVLSTADPVAVEIIVANIAGPTNASNTFANDFPDIKFFDLPGVTPVQAKNHSMRLASGRLIGFFDFDLIVSEGCLKTLVDYMDDHPDVGIAGPQIVDAYGATERTARTFHSLPATLAQLLPKEVLPDCIWKRANDEEWRPRSTREIDWLSGGAHILRRELIEDLGPLLEQLPSFHEQEYYLRSQKSGWHNFYIHEAQAVHPNPDRYGKLAKGGSSKSISVLELLHFFYRKWFGPRIR